MRHLPTARIAARFPDRKRKRSKSGGWRGPRLSGRLSGRQSQEPLAAWESRALVCRPPRPAILAQIPNASGIFYFAVFPVPDIGARRAELHDLAPNASYSFRTSRAIVELRTLRR